MKKFELSTFATADELARAAAGSWLDEIETARRTGKPYCAALSGGRITQKFFASVVEQAKARKIGDGGTPSLPGNVHFFWADERCVPARRSGKQLSPGERAVVRALENHPKPDSSHPG